MFQIQYESARRDEVIGVLLAFFLGCFGAHHFYLGRTGMGVLYICFCWTGIPAILGVIECFFMPGRVRLYNAIQAAALASALGIAMPVYPGWVTPGAGYAPVGATAGSAVGQAVGPAVGSAVGVTPGVAVPLVACASCGHANVAGARFCAGCGQALA
jgi:TM2 domain-containing membrane protein YozV